MKALTFKNLESGGDTRSAEGPVTACCPSRHGNASAMEPHSVARKGRAGSGRTARLGSHRHPREKSSAPPWSKPLLTSNQPWAQKRNAATTANPTQSGQWGRPMQIIRLPQLDGAGPPGANPWRESRQFCTSPVPSAPCCHPPFLADPSTGGSPLPTGRAGLAQAPPGQQEP